MYLFVVTLNIFAVIFVTAFDTSSEELQYKFPDVTIEAYSPRGLHVSIPDSDGIVLFAFHGNINKELEYIDAGKLSKDVVKKTGDRWIYQNKDIVLKPGDTVYFWLFVIRHNLGYRLDNQSYMIHTLLPQPEDYLPSNNRKPTKRPTHPTSPPHKGSRPISSKPSYLPHQPSRPVTESDSCVCPVCPSFSPTPTTTPVPVVMSTPSTIHTIVNIWAESLNNATEEKIDLTKQLDDLNFLNEHLLKVVKQGRSSDLRKLKMSGVIPKMSHAQQFVETVLREKLMVKNIVKDAERELDNSITFEMESYAGKLKVLQAANEKLSNSRIIITDAML